METKHIEIKTYRINDIDIHIKIDYDAEKISLITKTIGGEWENKKWIFACRGTEYMNGWMGIFDAMKSAIKLAQKELDLHVAIKRDDMIENVFKSDKAIKQLERKNKSKKK